MPHLISDIQDLLDMEHVFYLNAEQKDARLMLLGFQSLRLQEIMTLKPSILPTRSSRRQKCAGDIFIRNQQLCAGTQQSGKNGEEAAFAAESRFF